MRASLLKLYADQATVDKVARGQGKQAKKKGANLTRLREFFKKLDLGLEDDLEL